MTRLLGREDGCSWGDSHHSASLALKPRQELVEKRMFKEEKVYFCHRAEPAGEMSLWGKEPLALHGQEHLERESES